jgi:hypothetical protein
MSDIIDRLEHEQTRSGMWADTCLLLEEAAREIRKLMAERDEWRKACIAHGEKAERAEAALAEAVEECAKVADSFMASSDKEFDGVMIKHRKGQKNLELAAAASAGMSHAARKIAAAIRARKSAATP